MTQRKISLLGNFGKQNLGNECTLHAMIHNVRRYLPNAPVTCICTDPEDTSARYNIPAFPMSGRYDSRYNLKAKAMHKNPLIRLLKRIFIGVPRELLHWIRAFRTLKGTGMLIMTGTGMLGDFGISPFGLHYEIFKWGVVAKLVRCKLLFVSVGAGPLNHPLSKWFVKTILWLADYRSYRDCFSKQFLESIGFKKCDDPIYPDLAFSLPRTLIPCFRNHNKRKSIIGLGLMEYYGKSCDPQQGQAIYQDYIDKLSLFVTWLVEHGYSIRLVIGDVLYDKRVTQDVQDLLQNQGLKHEEGQIINEPVLSFEMLLSQLVTIDMLVATRFHNVLLGLMLNKPVISISYQEKNDSLMAEMGLEEYCQHIDQFDINKLIRQFSTLQENAESLKPLIKEKVEANRKALDGQYARIFGAV